MKNIIKYLPFAIIITLNIITKTNNYNPESIHLFAIIAGTVLIVNMTLAIFKKINDYFLYGISFVCLLGILSLFFFNPLGEIYIRHIITGLYLGLFIVAFFPPLVGMKPFTFAFSERKYPKAVVESKVFLKINLVINYIWSALFLLAMILTNITYTQSDVWQTILATAIPIVLQLGVGLPATIKLPHFLTHKIQGDVMNFTSIKELFAAMPMGFNKDHAVNVDAVMQFELTGEETTNGYFTIKNQKCTYTEGLHENPTTTIKSDSNLWLDISNGAVSGDSAYINKEYEAEGDMSLLSNWGYLFSNSDNEEEQGENSIEYTFEYKTFKPNYIKKVVVFDGGPRDEGISKTTYFTKQFCKGLESAGAKVEYIRLKDKKFSPCIGCYSCWTKTPGECIYNDDMTALRKKMREANLIVFASPLYIFSVTGILKNFLDRQIPNLLPYLVSADNGSTYHPDRYPELGQQGFVVFSAAGFPEVANNYDGLIGLFRMMDAHSSNMHMMGEFYIPAAETLIHSVYKSRKDTISDTCYNAGIQAVKHGKIDTAYMQAVTKPGVSIKAFQNQANNFWEMLDGKQAYLKSVSKM